MESLSIGTTELLVLTILLALPIISLIDLARRMLTGVPLALWVLIICALPVLGSLAYWIIRPTAENKV